MDLKSHLEELPMHLSLLDVIGVGRLLDNVPDIANQPLRPRTCGQAKLFSVTGSLMVLIHSGHFSYQGRVAMRRLAAITMLTFRSDQKFRL